MDAVLYGLCLTYGGLMLAFLAGWMRLRSSRSKTRPNAPEISVSIIIPARNEARNITNCLEDMLGQDYPDPLLEVMVIDDRSTDNTAALVDAFQAEHPTMNLTLLAADRHTTAAPKKAALQQGIAKASGTLIVTTDADCRFPPTWVRSLAQTVHDHGATVVLGPVLIHGPSLSGALQTLESLSLIAVTAGAAGCGQAVMANGANLAYARQAFQEVDGFQGIDHLATGDDVLLLHKFKRHQRQSIRFDTSPGALVQTSPAIGWRAFLQQRLRWASKAKAYRDPFTLLTMTVVGAFNLALAIGSVLALLEPTLVQPLLVSWAVKAVVDLA
ncbi:MAG: glycosyltransferase, partial [Bacteroidota bacterium]